MISRQIAREKGAEIGKYTIPLSIVADRDVSIFETIVEYLKEHYGLSYHEIAVLLNRDDRTIWTVYNRASKKRAKGLAK
jgi:hypothetical protein